MKNKIALTLICLQEFVCLSQLIIHFFSARTLKHLFCIFSFRILEIALRTFPFVCMQDNLVWTEQL